MITGKTAKTYAARGIQRLGPFGRRYYAMVYAIEAIGSGMVKFGRTMDIHKRLRALQTASPVSLELRGYVWLPDDAEADIHSHLDELRTHGEWFRAEGDALKVADLISAGDVRALAELVGIRGFIGE